MQADQQGRWLTEQVGTVVDVPALTANIFAAANNRTKICKIER
jgi:hypothetical protein